MIDKFEPYILPNFGYVRFPAIELTDKEKSFVDLNGNCTNEEFLIQLTKKGFEKRLQTNEHARNNPELYVDRIKLELDAFAEYGISAYILLVWKIINFCDQNEIARGFGRGSVGGSLVCYLINIVQRDPIKDQLFFERFVSKTRSKKQIIDGVIFVDGGLAPDVDIDIEQAKRHLVVEYINSIYPNKVSKIVTLNTLSGRLLIKECGKIISEHPEAVMTEVANLIPKVSGFVADIEDAYKDEPKFRDWCDKNKEVYEIALKLRDLNKNSSTHASGYLISYDNLEGRFPLQLGPEKELVCGFDMNQASKLTIKLDILGLRCCSVIADVAKQVGLDIYSVNLDDDPIIYDNLQDLKTPHGLFQIEADTALRVTNKVQPKNLRELADILSIARPGALAYLDDYVAYKNDPSLIESVHPIWDKILKTTNNQPLFQEEMMQICHELFKFTLEDAEQIRRACAKKKPEEIKKWKEKIYKQSIKENLDINLADRYWKLLDESSKYSFNKCLGGNTIIEKKEGIISIDQIKIGDNILAFDINNNKNHYVNVIDIHKNEIDLYQIEMEDGRKIECSLDHKFLTKNGMMELRSILKNNFDIILDTKLEYFKDIKGYEGLYKISNFGRILSKQNNLKYLNRLCKWHFIKGSNLLGYKRATLIKKNNSKRTFIHRLVAQAFIPNPKNKPFINHKNCIKTDNRIENLEWCTQRENTKHAIKNKLFDPSKNNRPEKICGSKNKNAKLNELEVLKMKKLRNDGYSYTEIAETFPHASFTVCYRACKGIIWKHVK